MTSMAANTKNIKGDRESRIPYQGRSATMWLFLLIVLVLLLLSLYGLAANIMLQGWDRAASFGASFGFASALFSGLGLVGIIATLLIQGQRELENVMNQEYRNLIEKVPVAAWLSPPLEDEEVDAVWNDPSLKCDEPDLRWAYRYFDLSNSQAFLYKRGRISKKTWEGWEDGIRDNMRRRWFLERWVYLRRQREATGADCHLEYMQPLVPAPTRKDTTR